jgi:phosphoenolpyruvate carboxykinase (ATP)
VPLRVVTTYAWHSLFARNLFIIDQSAPEGDAAAKPSSMRRASRPIRRGTRSDVLIALNFAKGLVLIGGTSYAGEIKKSVFSTMNYLLPFRDVLPMHCSANVGASGDVAVVVRTRPNLQSRSAGVLSRSSW